MDEGPIGYQKTIAKSLVIPMGEGDKESLREFYDNNFPFRVKCTPK